MTNSSTRLTWTQIHVYAFCCHSLSGRGRRSTMQVPAVNGQRDSPFSGLPFLLTSSFLVSLYKLFLFLFCNQAVDFLFLQLPCEASTFTFAYSCHSLRSFYAWYEQHSFISAKVTYVQIRKC